MTHEELKEVTRRSMDLRNEFIYEACRYCETQDEATHLANSIFVTLFQLSCAQIGLEQIKAAAAARAFEACEITTGVQ